MFDKFFLLDELLIVICCGNDWLVFVVYGIFCKCGFVVLEDVLVVGYDDYWLIFEIFYLVLMIVEFFYWVMGVWGV